MNLALSWALVVLIWLVQIIIYPGFERMASDRFIDYHSWYVKRISIIVLPLMIGEAAVIAAWLFADTSFMSVASAVAVVLVWSSTFSLQMPLHRRLSTGKQTASIRRLVATNWIRTISWSLKAALGTVAVGGQL